MSELPLVHVDAGFLVLDKPAGLLAVPGRGADKQDCLSARVQRDYPEALIVHRLDQATSGLLVMARGGAAQSRLGRAFALRQVGKRYVALVRGHLAGPQDDWATIDLPLLADWPNRPRQKVDLDQGKPSQTRWRVLAYQAGATRVELAPLTGRSHQLRVHLMALGHPIVGDTLYGPDSPAARLMLHATRLEFADPDTGIACRFDSPTPF